MRNKILCFLTGRISALFFLRDTAEIFVYLLTKAEKYDKNIVSDN